METTDKTTITVETIVHLPADKVWELWTKPEHITQWNFAADSWHCPTAANNIKPGGEFSWRMEAKDGSMGFDFSGVYEQVTPNECIISKIEDGRQITVNFTNVDNGTKVTETFEAENTHSIDQQRVGWQAILNNFKKYAETKK